jgi:branched-chain amino acid transport system permease protein
MTHLGSARLTLALSIVAAAALVVSTFVDRPQINDWLFRISTLVMLATSWNLMANAGLISLGHSAFWGVGSYAAVLSANKLGLNIIGSLLAAAVMGAVLGAILAVVTGRLRGIFFAIATLALSEGLRISALMLPDVTGGAVGLFLRQELRPQQSHLFLTGALLAIASVVVAALIAASRLQYASRAMRNNEAAAQMLGIDPGMHRAVIVTISGAMASTAGGMNSWYGGYLDPEVAFTLHFTILSQIAPILGGIYTVAGPVVGAIAIVGFSEGTRIGLGTVEGFSQLAFGVILVGCVLFMPNGLVGLWRSALGRRGGASKDGPAPLGRTVATAGSVKK